MLKALEKYQDRYETVILAGDFNASPQSHLWDMVRECGFLDVYPQGAELSFDKTRNSDNHNLQKSFPLTLKVGDLPVSNTAKEVLRALAREQESRPRRIDHIWVRNNRAAVKIKEVQLIGLPNCNGLAPSDHFGICADLELR